MSSSNSSKNLSIRLNTNDQPSHSTRISRAQSLSNPRPTADRPADQTLSRAASILNTSASRTQSTSPTAYVAQLRSQRATHWVKSSQRKDPQEATEGQLAKARATMEVCRANDPGETIAGGSAGSSSLEMVSKRKIRDLGPAKERLNTTNSLAGFPFSNFTTQFFVPEEFGHFVLCKVLFRDQRERANSKAVRAFHALLWQLFAQISSENEEYVARNAQLGISLTGFPEEGVVAHGAEDGGNGENLLEEVKNQAVKLHDDMFQRRYKIVFDCMYEYDSTYGRGRFEREVLRFMRICPIYQMPYTAVGKRKVYRNY